MSIKDDPKGYIIRKTRVSSGGCWEWQGCLNYNGYGVVGRNNYTVKTRAHQIAYIAYKGEYDKRLLICHTCNNSKCCNPEHLYAGTLKQNMTDRDKSGTTAKGERHGRSKLLESQVKEILSLKGVLSERKLAVRYGVSNTAIGYILRHKNWSKLYATRN